MQSQNKRAWRLCWFLQAVCLLGIALTVSAQHSIIIRTMLQSILPATAFTYTLDAASPVGTDAPSTIDDKIRETRYGFQERLNVDHYFPLTGTQMSDTATGQHRQVEFYGPISTPSSAANKGFLYSKDVTALAELHWLDESGNEVQFTNAGAFNVALLTSKTITTPTLTSPVINTGVSGTAVLDEDDMASNSATQLATQQSIKAYADAAPAAQMTPASYAGEESITFPNGLIFKHGKTPTPVGNHPGGTPSVAVSFGAAFPNAIISVLTNVLDDNAQASVITNPANVTVSGFNIRYVERATIAQDMNGIYWQAWGY